MAVNPRSKSGIAAFVVVSLLLILVFVVVVYFVIVPNFPSSSEHVTLTRRENGQPSLASFIFGILAAICVVKLFIFSVCVYYSWYKSSRTNYSVTDPLKLKDQVSYRTDSSVSRHIGQGNNSGSDKRHGYYLEYHTNLGYQKDESDRGSDISGKTNSRSSFVDDLYRSFQSIQGSRKNSVESDRIKKGRSTILESVDEEGYHFDTVDLTEECDNGIEEINTCEAFKPPPLKRLDTFDKNIIAASEERKLQKTSSSSVPSELFQSKPEKPPLLRRSTTQESFQGLTDLKSFDNYLSIVKVDSVPSFLDLQEDDIFHKTVDRDSPLTEEAPAPKENQS